MNLGTQKVRHVNSITHDGKVVVVGTGIDNKIYYSIKRGGFEDTAVVPGADLFGFEPWQELRLGESSDDPSVTTREKETLSSSSGQQLLRSVYGSAPEVTTTINAPVQVLSVLGHVYVFRQAPSGKILVSRFVLDGMTNKLIPKLEVRFARSKQRYSPQKSDTSARSMIVDTLDYRDVDGNPFLEPSIELTFAGDVWNGWFSPLFVPTSQGDRYRWHLFVWDAREGAVVHYSVGADATGLFDVHDYLYSRPDASHPGQITHQSIPGLIVRRIDLQGCNVVGCPSSTTYDLQKEQITNAGPQLMRDATRLMLAIPVSVSFEKNSIKTAILDFAIAVDGTLSQIDLTPDESTILRSDMREVVTPLSLFDDIKEFAQVTPPPAGTIVATERGVHDFLQIRSKEMVPADLSAGTKVKIRGTRTYDGHYKVVGVQGSTFLVDAVFENNEAGFWEVTPDKQTGLVFDDMVVGTEKTADGQLKILCPAHDLKVGDEVQISGTRNYNGIFPIESVDASAKAFVLNAPFFTGEAANLSKVVRRGLRMNGNDFIETPDLKLSPPIHNRDFEHTLSAWVRVHANAAGEKYLVASSDCMMYLAVDFRNKPYAVVSFGGSLWPLLVSDTESIPLDTWTHLSACLIYSTAKAGETCIRLYRNGIERQSQKIRHLPSHLGNRLIAFDGRDDRVEVPAFTNPTNAITVAAWVYSPTNTWTESGCLVSKRDAFILHPNIDSREISFYLSFHSGMVSVSCTPDEIMGWHHYSATYDGQTLRIYVDGVLAGETSTTVTILADDGPMLIGQDDDFSRYFSGNIAAVEVWDRARSEVEIAQSLSKRRTGGEPGLVGYWPLDDGTTRDLSRNKRHGVLHGDAQWEEIVRCYPQPFPSSWVPWNAAPLSAGASYLIGWNFCGEIADVQIWNVARSADEVKKTMHQQLTGKEQGLEANYRLGAISYETTPSTVTDFSYHGRNAIVHGEPYAGARRLCRATPSGMKVVKYGSDELIAVSQGGVYEETFEFRVTSPNASFDPGNADGSGQKLFTFSYWGKLSRGSEEIVEFPLDNVRQYDFIKASGDDGWYIAKCRVIVPENVSLMRAFEISSVKGRWGTETTPPAGEWTAIDIRKHHIRLLSGTITRERYSDQIQLKSLPGPAPDVVNAFAAVRNAERVLAQSEKQLVDLRDRLEVAMNDARYRAEREDLKRTQYNLYARWDKVQRERNEITDKPYNYYQELQVEHTQMFLSVKGTLSVIQDTRYEESLQARQQWQFIANGDGTYGIKSRHDGTYLGVDSAARIYWFVDRYVSADGPYCAKWKIEKYDDEYSYVRTVHNDMVIDVQNAWLHPQARVWLYNVGHSNNRWKIKNTAILTPEAQAEVDAKDAEFESLTKQIMLTDLRLAWLNQVLTHGVSSKQLELELKSVQAAIATYRAELGVKNAAMLNLLGSMKPAAMPELATDMRNLVTSGAVLDFAKPIGAVKLTESCEGQVLLTYFDAQGCMQSTRYDAVADSRNATFEQWLPEGVRACVYMQHDPQNKSKIKLEQEIGLPTTGWTCEAWVHYPPATDALGYPLATNMVACANNTTDSPLVIRKGRRLGLLTNGWFFDSGVDLCHSLATGYHHFAVSTSRETTSFYTNGVKVGSRKTRQPVLEFNGSTDYVEVPAHANPTVNLTISIWAKSEAAEWNASGCLVSKRDAFIMHPDAGTHEIQFLVFIGGGWRTVRGGCVDIYDWHLYTGTYDGNNVRLYIDGEFVAETAVGTLDRAIAADTGVMRIGQDDDAELPNRLFHGQIAEVSYWDVALGPVEIRESYYKSLKGDETGLVGYWRMEKTSEGDGFKVKDLTSKARHGVVKGTPKDATITSARATSVGVLGNVGLVGTDSAIGRFAELRLWDLGLSDAEIAIHAKTWLSGNEPGLLAYWPLDEGSGTTARDHSARGRAHGTLSPAVQHVAFTASVGNPGGNVLSLSDSPGAHVSSSPGVALAGKSFTIECWARRNVGSAGVAQCLISMGSPTQRAGLTFGFQNSSQFAFGFWMEDLVSLQPYTDTEWHHWCATYDKTTRMQRLYRDGVLVRGRNASGDFVGSGSLWIGRDFSSSTTGANYFQGEIAEVRIWDKARSEYEIQQTMRQRMTGQEPNLLACFPMDAPNSKHSVIDLKSGGYIGALKESAKVVYSTTHPLAGQEQLISTEYSTVEVDPNGVKQALMRRFYAYVSSGTVQLLADKRVEELTLQWVGNAQIHPTLLGYIEGAPPVPSENLTEAIDSGYKGATSVALKQTEGTTFTWERTQGKSHDYNLDTLSGAAWAVAVTAGNIWCITTSQGKSGYVYKESRSKNDEQSTSVAASSSTATSDSLQLTGRVEDKPMSNVLGKRWIPKNVGYALVISGMADVFVSKLKRSGRMVAYDIRPIEGLPLDINTITFMINPAYIMNGSLDGMVGSMSADPTFYPHVPTMRAQYGSLYPASYFRLKEAYALKESIQRQDKARESFFYNFNADMATPIDESEAPSVMVPDIESFTKTTDPAEISKSTDAMAADGKKEMQKREADIRARATKHEDQVRAEAAFADWQTRMEKIQTRAAKRNIVNTYVWDGDGGMHSQEESFASTIEHSISSDYTRTSTEGGMYTMQYIAAASEFSLVNTTGTRDAMSKTLNIEKALELSVDLSGVESDGITDLRDCPIKPGEKVDRYRFMTFYLEGSTDHFNMFFEHVVDPEWLQGNDEEARALRMAKSKSNKCWRVLHRVTYVERPALMDFGRDTRTRNS